MIKSVEGNIATRIVLSSLQKEKRDSGSLEKPDKRIGVANNILDEVDAHLGVVEGLIKEIDDIMASFDVMVKVAGQRKGYVSEALKRVEVYIENDVSALELADNLRSMADEIEHSYKARLSVLRGEHKEKEEEYEKFVSFCRETNALRLSNLRKLRHQHGKKAREYFKKVSVFLNRINKRGLQEFCEHRFCEAQKRFESMKLYLESVSASVEDLLK